MESLQNIKNFLKPNKQKLIAFILAETYKFAPFFLTAKLFRLNAFDTGPMEEFVGFMDDAHRVLGFGLDLSLMFFAPLRAVPALGIFLIGLTIDYILLSVIVTYLKKHLIALSVITSVVGLFLIKYGVSGHDYSFISLYFYYFSFFSLGNALLILSGIFLLIKVGLSNLSIPKIILTSLILIIIFIVGIYFVDMYIIWNFGSFRLF